MNSRLNKKSMGSLAWTIQDTGAIGGIVVSPLDLQSGARKIAASANVQHVILHPDSTTSDYLMSFLNQIFVGMSERLDTSDACHVQIIQDGKIIGERKDNAPEQSS